MIEPGIPVVEIGLDGKYACPECRENYPERTVAYDSAAGLSSHRKFRHGVDGQTPGYGGNPRLQPKFEKTDRGTFVCPECKQDDFKSALLVGRHRFYDHGIKVNPAKAKRKIGRPRKHPEAENPVQRLEVRTSESLAPPFVVAYLFGRVEFEIENYAKNNGLAAGSLKNDIGDLLKQSA